MLQTKVKNVLLKSRSNWSKKTSLEWLDYTWWQSQSCLSSVIHGQITCIAAHSHVFCVRWDQTTGPLSVYVRPCGAAAWGASPPLYPQEMLSELASRQHLLCVRYSSNSGQTVSSASLEESLEGNTPICSYWLLRFSGHTYFFHFPQIILLH